MNNVKITEAEVQQLVYLMNKVTFPAPLPVFEAWCRVFGIVCVEVLLERGDNNFKEVFLTYRNDKFFKGWHIPGCVHLPQENIETTLHRVLNSELSMEVNEPKFFGWFERMRGEGRGQSKRGYELAIVFSAALNGEIRENKNEKFFPVTNLPDNIISFHLPIIKKYTGTSF